MSTERTKATEVWEIPLRDGKLRVCLKPGEETQVMIEHCHMSGPTDSGYQIVLDVRAWRSLCDLRNKIRPARQKRSTP